MNSRGVYRGLGIKGMVVGITIKFRKFLMKVWFNWNGNMIVGIMFIMNVMRPAMAIRE